MSLLNNLSEELKTAMRAKEVIKLEALRAIKSAMLLAQTSLGASSELSENEEIKLLQKLVKQRKDSATIFKEQNRRDLADPEEAQAAIISQFLPDQISEDEVGKVIEEIIGLIGADGMKDMGKVMGMASKQLAGKADGKTVSNIVKAKLSI